MTGGLYRRQLEIKGRGMQSSNSYVGLVRVPTRLLVVGGLHLAVVWALINGLHIRTGAADSPGDITTEFLEPHQPPPE